MITVSGLTKTYGDRTVVDDVSFELEPGTVTGFLGPNGAGKTTTMRMITGLVPATAGQALVAGQRYADAAEPRRGHGHACSTPRRCTPVAPGARTCGSSPTRSACPAERVDEVLELVGPHAPPPDAGSAATRSACGSGSGIAGGAAGRPAGADVRRAGQRPGPGGHPLDARPAAQPRRPRRHGAAVLAPARRGAAHGRPARRHRRRADRRRRTDASAARRRRHRRPGARPATRSPRAGGRRSRGQPGEDGVLVVPGAPPTEVGAVAAAGGHVLTDLRPLEHGLEDVFFQLTTAA